MNVNIALLTVTDTRTLKTDKSGNLLLKKIKKAKHNLIERKICKDNKKDIKKILKNWLKKKKIDVIITTGGTGLTGRDITPEAIEEIADKKIPGFGEIFRFISLKTVRQGDAWQPPPHCLTLPSAHCALTLFPSLPAEFVSTEKNVITLRHLSWKV